MLLRPINELCDLAKKVQFASFQFISLAVLSHIYSFLYFLPTLLSLSHGHTGVLAVLRLLHIIRRVVSKVLCPLLICWHINVLLTTCFSLTNSAETFLGPNVMGAMQCSKNTVVNTLALSYCSSNPQPVGWLDSPSSCWGSFASRTFCCNAFLIQCSLPYQLSFRNFLQSWSKTHIGNCTLPSFSCCIHFIGFSGWLTCVLEAWIEWSFLSCRQIDWWRVLLRMLLRNDIMPLLWNLHRCLTLICLLQELA